MRSFDDISAALSEHATTCENIIQEYLATIDARRDLNAFLAVDAERALVRARQVDEKRMGGDAGPLAGMVVAVKDNICIKDWNTTCASKILEEFVAPYNATTIEKLSDADAIIIGKTNMDEFAMGSSTENSAFGRVKHPVDASRVPGGSSGGSAVAVSAGMCTTALGSDTGGSIRQPASFTGIVGLKPTYGRVSRYGLVAFASSLDQIGPFAVTVRDAARLLQAIAGHDERDSTTAKVPVPDYLTALNRDVKGLKIGVPREYFDESLRNDIRAAIETQLDILRSAGAEVRQVSLPHADYTVATYYILATAEASSNLARFDGARYGFRADDASTLKENYTKSRSRGFGQEVKRRIMLGTYVLSSGYYDAYYLKGQKVRRLISSDFERALSEVDVLIGPTSPTTSFKAGEKTDDPLQMYLSDIYTTSANLAGIPAVSIPCGTDGNNLPIGLQIMGKQFDEETVLRVADFLETRA
ncbi:MAG: Asp-tRNA(Asn)/Glu-tRNA(Gln) amidotransferase subunit GatA [Ignavibacteria bacterium]|nr:Asp-tRNA(Asn)/Glu-tRNA(Gln) amidotransferase subunit GatA [Ignavibacteria bacterium]